MKPEAKTYAATVGSQTITFETGKLAGQAGGAVTIKLGESIIFASATMGGVREGIDFFPLSVDFEERLYASGKIPGSFFRREGRPGTEAILIARLTDRPLRPLFPKGMRNEVQIIMFSISADVINPLDILAINAASTAVMISDIPWNGPVGAVRVGRVDGEFVINPTFEQLNASDLDLRIAGTRDAILMVECGANEVPEDVMVAALELGHQAMQPLIDLQFQMQAEIGKEKREATFSLPDEDLAKKVFDRVSGPMNELLDKPLTKAEFYGGMTEMKDQVVEEFCTVPEGGEAADYPSLASVREAFDQAEGAIVRERILSMGKRPDGRGPKDLRDIWAEVDLSPRAHGSGLFTRGETQVLTLATLGTLGEAQEIDSLSPIESKRYLHHYNFPPYSVGEVRRLRGQSRREVGHGALAERALEPVIPAEETFPYTLRLVSEVLSSNGSTSMASVCGSTLSLMDAGVPIKAPVAGIAMGLITDPSPPSGEQAGSGQTFSRYKVLTDIQGTEDHLGDMDFKVAGTKEGITALQMDIKISGLSADIMKEALEQARVARLAILDIMLEAIPQPRAELKDTAPRITTVKIPVDKIGALIGPGGKNIRALQEETGTRIDIEEDGTVYIAAVEGTGAQLAIERIEALGESPEIGRIYTGKVVRIEPFGAFVEILPGTDGLVHISQLDSERVNSVEDIVGMGDEITVMITDIDPMGKIRLSRQAVLEGWSAEEAREHDKPRGGGRSGGRSSNRRGGRRNDRRGGQR
jgi:polyribonucleotide nucleotidyltransferase